MGMFFNQSKAMAGRYMDSVDKTEQSLNNTEQVVYMISAKGYLEYLENKESAKAPRRIRGGQSRRTSAAGDEEYPA